jgi:hypothetical protein
VKSVRAIKFGYRPTRRTRELLETFRMMVNDAIRIALNENIRGRLNLRNRIYRQFRERHQVTSAYPYSVAEVAWSIVKKHQKWRRRPVAQRLMMKMDSARSAGRCEAVTWNEQPMAPILGADPLKSTKLGMSRQVYRAKTFKRITGSPTSNFASIEQDRIQVDGSDGA